MLYTWNNADSLIKQVEIFTPRKKENEALIYAPDGVAPGELQTIAGHLREKGFTTIPDTDGDHYVLRVQKFGSREELFDALEKTKAISGTPEALHTKRDDKLKKSFSETLKENSVVASGWVYLLGDALVLASGLVRRSASEVFTGVVWGSTGVVLAGWGKKNPDKQMELLYKRLEDHLKHEGVDIPTGDEATIERLAAKGGVVNKIVQFLYDHPVEFNNTLQALGGLSMIHSGLSQRNPLDGKANYFKAAAGVSVSNGQFWGMMIDPKDAGKKKLVTTTNPDDLAKAGPGLTPIAANGVAESTDKQAADNLPMEDDHRSLTGKVVDWFHAKPLRITGVGASANNLLNLAGGLFFERPRIKEFLSREVDANGNAVYERSWLGRNQALQGKIDEATTAMRRRGVDKAAAREELFALHQEQQKLGIEGSDEFKGLLGKARDYEKGYMFNVGAALSYLVANTLYGMSSKDTNADLKAVGGLSELYSAAAHVIHSQPYYMQNDLVGRIAGNLAAQPSVKETAEDISAQIKEKLAGLNRNPWETQPAMVQQPASSAVAVDAPETRIGSQPQVMTQRVVETTITHGGPGSA